MTKETETSPPSRAAISFGALVTKFANVVRQGALDLVRPVRPGTARSAEAIVITGQGAFLALDGTEQLVPVGPEIMAGLAGRAVRGPVDLVFRDNSCIDIAFSVPTAPLAELARIIETEIQFRSPFAEAVTLPFWTAREQSDGRWKINAAVVLRTRVADLLADLQANRVPLGLVWREGPAARFCARPSWAGGTLAKPRFREVLAALPRPLLLGLAGSAFFLASAIALTVSLGLSAGRLSAGADAARASLSARAETSANLSSLERSLDLSADRLAMTGRLSGILPDGFWLDQLAVEGDTVTLTGYGPSAAEVTRLLTALPELTDITFASPVTRDNAQSLERYRIAATLVGAAP